MQILTVDLLLNSMRILIGAGWLILASAWNSWLSLLPGAVQYIQQGSLPLALANAFYFAITALAIFRLLIRPLAKVVSSLARNA